MAHTSIQGPRVGVLLLLSFGVCDAAHGAGAVDASITPRQRFDGSIAFSGDVDRVEYPAIAGTDLSFVIAASGGSKVLPRVAVLDGGQPLQPAQSFLLQGGREQRAVHFSIVQTGTLTIEISAANGSIGDYRLRVRERVKEKLDWKVAIPAGGTQSLTFPGRFGESFVLKVDRLGSGIAPLVDPKLVSPAGDEISLDGALTSQSGGLLGLQVGPLTLDEDGTYRIDLGADPSGSEKLHARIQLDPLTPVSIVTEEPGVTGISGSLFIEGSDWLATESFDGDFLADELLVAVPSREAALEAAGALGADLVDWSGNGIASAPSAHGFARVRAHGAVPGRAAITTPERTRVAALCRSAMRLTGVTSAEPNHLRRNFMLPTDPLFPQQWDFGSSGFEHALDVTQGDATKTIAVLDTGVRFEHPDLAGKFAPGYDFVSDSWNASDGNGIDADPTDPILGNGTHGTHVSGTLVAASDNALGIAGGTRLGKVMPLRVLGLLGGTDFDIAQAILYAARLPNNSGSLPQQRAEVINMSLGGPSPSAALADAVAQALAAGVVVVAAAGNSNSKLKMYPAAIDGVIAVAATDRLDKKAFYSSFGPHISIAAPGGDPYVDADGDGVLDGIVSTVVDPGYGPIWAQKAGTSMACPHVAAAAFLLRSVNPALTPLEVRAVLCAGAVDLGAPGFDKYYGYGRLDAGHSLDQLLGTDAAAKDVFVCPNTVEFDAGVDARAVALVDVGNGAAVDLLGAHAGAFYLTVDSNIGALPRTLTFHVDRAALLPGSYTTSVALDTSVGPRSILVHVVVPESGSPPLVERAYVFAYDVAKKQVAQIVQVDHADAGHFQFDALPEGTYRVFAATDLDLDLVAGESQDFAGQYQNASSLDPKLAAIDGQSTTGLVIFLKQGGNSNLPEGGSFPVQADP